MLNTSGQAAETNSAEKERHLYLLSRKAFKEQKSCGPWPRNRIKHNLSIVTALLLQCKLLQSSSSKAKLQTRCYPQLKDSPVQAT